MLEALVLILLFGYICLVLALPAIASRWWLETNPPDEADDEE